MTDLTERLRDYSTCLQGAAWSRQDGGQDLSIGSILAEEAATTLETLTQEVERLTKYLNEIGLAAQVSAALCDPEDAEPFQMIADRARKALGGGDE